ncbi:MAG: substrate-binding domain-containing protein [Anaerolineae bacterium]|nr:substrate-binding domain-containing protein [Anaerolineae bacterium]
MEHPITTFERRQSILRLLQAQSSVHVGELAERFGVSEGTIRNDLTALEESQLVLRVRGGAVLRESQGALSTLATQARINFDAKRRIAQWAADMVEDGDAIALDASTTVLNIVPFLQERRNLTIVTNGIDVSRELARHPGHTVILVGGQVRSDGNATTGTLGAPMLKDLFIRTAFVSCVGLTFESGLTESDIQQAQVKQLLMRSAARTVALVDSSKFGKLALAPFASLSQIAHMVTDDGIDPAVVEKLRSARVGLTICGEDAVDSYPPHTPERKAYTIGFANLSEDIPFAVDVRRGLERAAQDAKNVDLVLADNQLSGEVALGVADHLIARGVDLVIEYQIDEKMGSVLIDRFQRAGIPVIAVDIPIVGATYFGVDNYRAGHMAGVALGQWIEQHWGGAADGLIVLEEPRSGTLTSARIQGQLDGLREIVGDALLARAVYLESGNTREISEANMRDALRSLPDTHRLAVISFNDDAAIGALNAAHRASREQHVVIVGQGADRRVRQELRQPGSRIIGSTAYTPERYGAKLIDLALRILRGEPAPPAVYVDHVFINAENLDLYYPD